VPIVVAAVSVGSLWVQWTTSSIRAEKAALEAAQRVADAKEEGAKVKAELERTAQMLDEANRKYKKVEVELERTTQTLDDANKKYKKVRAELTRVENELQGYRIRLLQNVVKNLDDTRNAVVEYHNDWRKVINLRDGNKAVEELLTLMLNVGLLPPNLADDLQKLKKHYQEWLEAYASRFPDGMPREHSEPIFVGTFPSESEANIRQCLKTLEAGRTDTYELPQE
jgi:chromosome segregation ATPase